MSFDTVSDGGGRELGEPQVGLQAGQSEQMAAVGGTESPSPTCSALNLTLAILERVIGCAECGTSVRSPRFHERSRAARSLSSFGSGAQS
jgi:hypothetical protein